MQKKYIALGLVLASFLLVTLVAGDAMAFGKGDRVLGKWKDGRWYPARINAVTGGQYQLAYDDGDILTVPASKLKKVNWTVGTKLQCNWKNKGSYYLGTITKMNGEVIHMSYKDGDQEDTTISRCRTP